MQYQGSRRSDRLLFAPQSFQGRFYDQWERIRPTVYEIVVKGKLDLRWSRWFADLQIIPQPNGNTLLTGPITDQAALYGVISRMRDLGVVLISVHRVSRE
jgi:hypothetical protein